MKIKSFVLIALLFVVLTAGITPAYEVGDSVANFTLKSVENKNVSLADYKSEKGVIVIFDCNTCPYSKSYNDRILALDKKYRSQGFPVVAINSNDPVASPGDSFDEMVSHAKKKKYSFPYLFDEKQDVAKAFGATNTPHVFVLKNNGGTFQVAYIGAIDNNVKKAEDADKKYVEEAVEALIAGKDVSTPKTKAIGCGIKWKKS